MSATFTRRLALVWWVRNHNRGNAARASRWQRLAERHGKGGES
jgi:hypothetical protein